MKMLFGLSYSRVELLQVYFLLLSLPLVYCTRQYRHLALEVKSEAVKSLSLKQGSGAGLTTPYYEEVLTPVLIVWP